MYFFRLGISMAILRTTLITNLHVRKNCYCINLLNTQKFRFNFIMYNGRAMKYNFNSTVLFVTFETVITNQIKKQLCNFKGLYNNWIPKLRKVTCRFLHFVCQCIIWWLIINKTLLLKRFSASIPLTRPIPARQLTSQCSHMLPICLDILYNELPVRPWVPYGLQIWHFQISIISPHNGKNYCDACVALTHR